MKTTIDDQPSEGIVLPWSFTQRNRIQVAHETQRMTRLRTPRSRHQAGTARGMRISVHRETRGLQQTLKKGGAFTFSPRRIAGVKTHKSLGQDGGIAQCSFHITDTKFKLLEFY